MSYVATHILETTRAERDQLDSRAIKRTNSRTYRDGTRNPPGVVVSKWAEYWPLGRNTRLVGGSVQTVDSVPDSGLVVIADEDSLHEVYSLPDATGIREFSAARMGF